MDPYAFYEWAVANKAQAFTTAMHQHHESRSTAPYASLLRQFKATQRK